MKSEMDPYDLFVIFSECIHEFLRVLEGSVYFAKSTHSLWSDFPIGMEKFMDKVDEYESSSHKCIGLFCLPSLESRELPECHLAHEDIHMIFFHRVIDDCGHPFDGSIFSCEFSVCIAERTPLFWVSAICFRASFTRIFIERHTTGLALLHLHRFEHAEELIHRRGIREVSIFYCFSREINTLFLRIG